MYLLNFGKRSYGLEGSRANRFSDSLDLFLQQQRSPRSCFLQILDLPVNGERGKCVAQTTSLREIAALLDALPPLVPGVMRVYVEELPESSPLASHLNAFAAKDHYERRFSEWNTAGDKVVAMAAQWQSPLLWLRTRSFLPVGADFDLRCPSAGCIETMNSLCTIPIDQEKVVGRQSDDS